MPRVIFKCPHVKGGTPKAAAHLGNAVNYYATRKGVQRIDPGKMNLPATENQVNMVEKLAREFPLSKGLEEYADYQESPTRGNASEFITRAIEENLDQIAKMENYVDYIAKRPRAQRFGSHGLFTSGSDSLTLSKIQEEVAHHPGTVWLPVISLRREDAARLGFDNAERWKEFLSGYSVEMAQAMKIPLEQFRWYAAFHDESHHPHVHMYLTRPQTEIALRYGIPIGVRDKYGMHMGTPFGKPFRYVTVRNLDMLDKWLSFESTESLATIHADLPRGIQKKMREYILQIMEIECPECLPPPKPVAPILGAYGNTFNLLCIVNRALRQAGQMDQAEEMWRRVLGNGDNFKAISIMEEYVEFDEAYLPAAALCGGSLRGGVRA